MSSAKESCAERMPPWNCWWGPARACGRCRADDRRTWSVGRAGVLRTDRPARGRRPPGRPDRARGRQHRSPRPDGHALVGRRRHLDRGSKPPAFDARRPARAGRSRRCSGSPRVMRTSPARWYAGGASPQGLFRTERRRRHLGAGASGGTTTRCGRRGASGPRRTRPDGSMLHSVLVDPRDAAHLYLGLSGGGVFESHRRRRRLGAAQPGRGRRLLPRSRPGVRPRPAHRPPAPARCPTGCTSRTTAASTGSTGPRIAGRASATTCRARSATSASRSSCTPATRTPPGCSRWTAPRCGRAPASTAGRRPTSPATPARRGRRRPTGLPDRAWFTVKRQAMTTDDADPVGVYFGTTCGEVWASADEGESWRCVARHLPEIYSRRDRMTA